MPGTSRAAGVASRRARVNPASTAGARIVAPTVPPVHASACATAVSTGPRIPVAASRAGRSMPTTPSSSVAIS